MGTQEKVALAYVKGTIKLLPAEMQSKVELKAEAIRAAVGKSPEGLLALALVGAEEAARD